MWFIKFVVKKAVIYDNRKDGSILRVVPTEDGKTVAIIYYRDAESNLNGNPVLSGMCR